MKLKTSTISNQESVIMAKLVYGERYMAKLARALDVNYKTVNRWKYGEANISDLNARKIVHLLAEELVKMRYGRYMTEYGRNNLIAVDTFAFKGISWETGRIVGEEIVKILKSFGFDAKLR